MSPLKLLHHLLKEKNYLLPGRKTYQEKVIILGLYHWPKSGSPYIPEKVPKYFTILCHLTILVLPSTHTSLPQHPLLLVTDIGKQKQGVRENEALDTIGNYSK